MLLSVLFYGVNVVILPFAILLALAGSKVLAVKFEPKIKFTSSISFWFGMIAFTFLAYKAIELVASWF
jgi:hypothetical protein